VRILQIGTTDGRGGAAAVTMALFRGYRLRGHDSALAVGFRMRRENGIFDLAEWGVAARGRRAAAEALAPLDGRPVGVRRSLRALPWMAASPRRALALRLGRENFDFPGTVQIPQLAGHTPDVLHAHNLHGGYFDLRALVELSHRLPFFVTMHDSWLLSGHCAYTLGCERWATGCGSCPDLSIYPAIPRDATAFNWRRKQEIYAGSRLHVATPSRWLLDKAERSMLAPGVVDARVIPNGVDTDVFHPGDQRRARQALSLPDDARIAMIAANGLRINPYKDLEFLRSALAAAETPLLVLAVGDEGPDEVHGAAVIRFVPYQDEEALAVHYRAADVFLHAARPESENFPNVVLEALASGTPVVATRVGGIPEQMVDGDTGILVAPENVSGFALAVDSLLADEQGRRRMGAAAAADVVRRFTLSQMADGYLAWYSEVLATRREEQLAGAGARPRQRASRDDAAPAEDIDYAGAQE
jgi:glycosyltransferase involved in cell wall biosynthesis